MEPFTIPDQPQTKGLWCFLVFLSLPKYKSQPCWLKPGRRRQEDRKLDNIMNSRPAQVTLWDCPSVWQKSSVVPVLISGTRVFLLSVFQSIHFTALLYHLVNGFRFCVLISPFNDILKYWIWFRASEGLGREPKTSRIRSTHSPAERLHPTHSTELWFCCPGTVAFTRSSICLRASLSKIMSLPQSKTTSSRRNGSVGKCACSKSNGLSSDSRTYMAEGGNTSIQWPLTSTLTPWHLAHSTPCAK